MIRLLLVRLREIGDVVFTTPAVRALREHFPGAHITYVVEPAAAPVVTGNPYIDHLVVAPRQRGLNGLAADVALANRLRRGGVDLAIDFHGGPRASLIVALSGAKRRVGYTVTGRSWVYTHRVPRTRALRARHSVENQWDLLAAIGVPGPDAARWPVEMPIDREVAGRVRARLDAAGVRQHDLLIVMHVSAGNPFRRWPLTAFARVAAALASDESRKVVVTSGPSERDAAARVIGDAQQQLGDPARHRVLEAGDFSLAELRALVERAALYIGGDSGPLHIAATSAIPVVGLYGPTLPARSAPWRAPSFVAEAVQIENLPCRPCDQRRCLPGDFRCLTWIQPDDVVAAAERALAASSR